MSTPSVLKSLIVESKDGEWGKGEPFDQSVEMAVIRGTDFSAVRVGEIGSLPVRFMPEHIAARKTLKPLDILIETAGGSKDRPTGRTVLVKESLLEKSELPLTCASFARYIRVDARKVYAPFLFWLLQNLYEQGFVRQYHTQHTGVARFQFTTFAERQPLQLPALATQRQIADVLSAYDDLIENNANRIKILEQMAQMLYREWFVNFRFPGHEKLRMVESEIGSIPAGWIVKKLGDVLRLEYGKALKADQRISGSVPVFGSSGIIGSHAEKLADGPGIIVGRKGNVGSVFFCDSDFWVIDTAYYVATSMPLRYIYFNLLTQNFLNNDAAVPGLNRNQAHSLPVVVPGAEVLREFENIVEPMCKMKVALEQTNSNLRLIRDLLLPKLISGKISVEQLESEAIAQNA
jgi:type I restriction enzyme, S subunit